ncbi:MAG: hypothetical protein ACHQIO_02485 [Nevskiales bacterium]
MQSFISELRRRNVLRVAAFYAAAGWLLVQVATQVFPFFDIANWVVRVVVVAIVLGFPAAMALAWFYELTPQGLKLESEITPAESITRQTGRKLDRWIIAVLGLAVVLLLADKLVLHPAQPAASSTATSNVAGGDKSIAVLPFDNLSDDKANAYFAIGIQDEILTRLAGIGSLKVISRTSTEKYASHPENLRTVGMELGVGTLLEGSVQKSGERVRVNVQLIDARNDAHLWASTYDRDLKDSFAVESEVSQDIADALKATLSPSETTALARLPTQNAAAYDLFLKAEHAAHEASDEYDEGAYLRAEDFYRRALVLDPGFALAHAELAYCQLSHRWFFSKPYSESELDAIQASVTRALTLAPDLPESHLAYGYLRYWGYRDYPAAAAAFRQVVALQPSNAVALLGLAAIDRRIGDWPQALVDFKKVADLSPRDSTIISEYALTLAFMHRYTEARDLFQHALAINPADGRAAIYLFRTDLLGLGEVSPAQQALQPVPVDHVVLYDRLGGDVLSLIGHRVYADVFARHFDEALKAWDGVASDGDEARLRKLAARAAIRILAGRRAAAKTDCDELARTQESALATRPDSPDVLTRLSWAYVCLGRGDDALRLARHAVDLLPIEKDAYFGTFYLNGLAQIEAQTGHADQAVPLLEKLLFMPAGGVLTLQRLKLDPVWDPLRQDPRFQKLIADGSAAATAQAGK